MKQPQLNFALFMHPQHAYDRMLVSGVADFARAHAECHFRLLAPSILSVSSSTEKYDGIICRVLDKDIVRKASRFGTPVIDTLHSRSDTGFSVVASDNVLIGRLAAEHFLEHRFANFAFVGYKGVPYSERRRDGFVSRLAEAGFKPRIYETDASRWPSTKTIKLPGFYEINTRDAGGLKRMLDKLPRPAAVFCCHDPRAVSVLDICNRQSVRVPEDIAILGVDNDFIYSAFSHPRLSSIDPAAEQIGFRAAQELLELAETPASRRHPRTILIPPKEIVVRESTEIYPTDPPWLSDALVYIRRNAMRGISACNVFENLGLSHTLVQKTFREKLGSSVQKEIVAVRMDEAKRLLKETSQPISEIAAACGFASLRYFSQAFSTLCGVSPSDWRIARKSTLA